MACGCEGAKCKLEPGDDRHGTAGGYTNRSCRCNACREAKRERARVYYEANREAERERGSAYRAANREAVLERHKAYRAANQEAVWERHKAYRAANQEALREYYKAYRAANREAERERSKAYYASHPDVFRSATARRRARKANAFIGPAFTRQQVWDRDNGTCHLCGSPANPLDWHMEHVIPLVRGGAHSFENCAVSCPTCNLRKGARLLDELAAGCTMSTVSH